MMNNSVYSEAPGLGLGDEADDMPSTEKDLAEDAPWKKIQQNTFTRWCNEHLKCVGKRLNDLQRDLSDGLRLIALLEVLSQKRMYRKFHPRPNFRQMKLENVSVALEFLEREHIKLVSIGQCGRGVPRGRASWGGTGDTGARGLREMREGGGRLSGTRRDPGSPATGARHCLHAPLSTAAWDGRVLGIRGSGVSLRVPTDPPLFIVTLPAIGQPQLCLRGQDQCTVLSSGGVSPQTKQRPPSLPAAPLGGAG